MKILNFSILILAGLLFLINTLKAQDDFQKWLQKDRQQFDDFLSAEDKAFADFLKQTWQPYESKKGKPRDTSPKPVKMPVAPQPPKPEVKKEPVPEPKVELPPPPPPVSRNPVRKPPAVPGITKVPMHQFSYLNMPIQVPKPASLNFNLAGPLTNQSFAEAWQQLAAVDHSVILNALDQLTRKMELNDWGRLQLLNSFTQSVFPNDGNRQRILLWFLLNKSGIDARVAFSKATVYVLFPSRDELFGNDFVKIDGKNYYFYKNAHRRFKLDRQVYTYKKSYNSSNHAIGLKIQRVPQLEGKTVTKTFNFTFNGEPVAIPVVYSTDVVRFFEQYPQTRLEVYFGAPVSNPARSSLLKALHPYVREKSQKEAVNFLLRFVQTAFDYQTDDQQFGHEKYLMPEETLFYPSSDCEDRSILFSYLVQNLLGMDVIGLDYPGHVASAVRFSSAQTGSAVEFRGRQYLICDPTYVNAAPGMCMPQFKDVTPKVIELL